MRHTWCACASMGWKRTQAIQKRCEETRAQYSRAGSASVTSTSSSSPKLPCRTMMLRARLPASSGHWGLYAQRFTLRGVCASSLPHHRTSLTLLAAHRRPWQCAPCPKRWPRRLLACSLRREGPLTTCEAIVVDDVATTDWRRSNRRAVP